MMFFQFDSTSSGRLALLLTVLSLAGCGAGGAGDSSQNNNASQSTPHVISSLAKIGTNGAMELALSNGRAFFIDQNLSEIRSVPVDGGEIVTHANFSALQFVPKEGKVLIPRDRGIYSISGTEVGISTLSALHSIAHQVSDVAMGTSSVYWSEYDGDAFGVSRIWRTPLITTSTTPISTIGGYTTDQVVDKVFSGIVRLVLDNTTLYVSESEAGNIYRINTLTGAMDQIASAISPGRYNTLSLAATTDWLFVLTVETVGLNSVRKLTRINKITGASTEVTGPGLESFIAADSGHIYWWKFPPSGPGRDLVQMDDATGQSRIIVQNREVQLQGTSAPYSDGTNIWWFNSYFLGPLRTSDNMAELWTVPVAGGIPVMVKNFDPSFGPYTNYKTPAWFQTDNSYVYWVSVFSEFWRVPKDGTGVPEKIPVQESGVISRFLFAGDQFVWADLRGIRKMAKSGVNEITLEWEWSIPANSSPTTMTSDLDNFYWTTEDYNPVTTVIQTSIYAKPLVGGSQQLLGIVPGGHTNRIVPYQDSLLIARNSGSGGGISVMPKAGGTAVELLRSDSDGLNDIFVLGDVLYIMFQGVYSLNLNTGTLNTLSPIIPRGNRLYVDTNHIYWTENNGAGSGAVQRMPVSGGQIEPLYNGSWCFGITGDAQKVYWMAGNQLLSTPK
jgi:hypothetical protein